MKSALTFYWQAATGTLPTRVVIINGRSLQKPDFLAIAGKHSIHYPGDKRPIQRIEEAIFKSEECKEYRGREKTGEFQ